MKKIEKPVFTKEELDEEKTGVQFGYRPGTALVAGYDFGKPFQKKYMQIINKIREGIGGIKKMREAHEMINQIGWATYYGDDKLYFGLKWSCINSGKGPTRIGESAIKKYKQLIGYYLQEAGWVNISVNEDGNYEVPLDCEQNLNNLHLLSQSIGFYYKAKRPTLEDIARLALEKKADLTTLSDLRRLGNRNR